MGEAPSSIDIVNQIESYIRSSVFRKANQEGGVGLSPNTIRMYRSLSSVWSDYLIISSRSSILLKDLDRKVIEGFSFWLLHEKKYALNYVGQLLKMTKTIIRDAQKSGYEIHPYTTYIESFTEGSEDRRVITLTEEEIKRIEGLSNLSTTLDNHRRWMLLGLHVGQRVSDLLSLKPHQIREADDGLYLDFFQKKTRKAITVGVRNPLIVYWLSSFDFKPISDQAFNRGLKMVAQKAGIHTMTEGYQMDRSTRRRSLGLYPKYQLISSHSLRRTFATLHYGKVPTPLIMEITGHSKETTFLSYIGKTRNKDHIADTFLTYLNF